VAGEAGASGTGAQAAHPKLSLVGQIRIAARQSLTRVVSNSSGDAKIDIQVFLTEIALSRRFPTNPRSLSAARGGDLGYQVAAQGLGTVKAGLRYLITKDGPAAGFGGQHHH